jgi:hypothetical protein
VLNQDSTVNSKDWYSVTIQRLPDGEKVWIGSMAFEQSSSTAAGSNGIESGWVSWTEVYLKEKAGGETPTWHVSMDEVLADGTKPVQAHLLYADSKFRITSNTFTRKNEVHFIMGTKVQRFHNKRYIKFK